MMATIAEMYRDLGLTEEANQLLEARVQLARQEYGPYGVRTARALADLALNIGESSHASRRAAVIEEASRFLDRQHDETSLTRAPIWARARTRGLTSRHVARVERRQTSR